MDRRALILDTARKLTMEHGVVPSLNAVAAAASVSKGGLIHHFPSRESLVRGLAEIALHEVDQAMEAATAEGRAAQTWLRISVPVGEDVRLFRALAVAHRAVETPGDDVAAAAAQLAIQRWEAMIERETHAAARARVIRLVGDGLAANLIAGIEPPPTQQQLEDLIAVLLPVVGGADE